MTDHAPQRSILVVDDDDDIRLCLRELLEGEHFHVMTASNGQIALDILRSGAAPPGLILLDLMMPVKDGAAFLAEQRRDASLSAIPVVIMSAVSGVPSASERLGVRDYVTKPIDVDALLSAIGRHLH